MSAGKLPYTIVSPLRRHDQRNTMWVKSFFEESYRSRQLFFFSDRFREGLAESIKLEKSGYRLEDCAFWYATWYLAQGLQDLVDNAGNELYYAWKSAKPLGMGRMEVDDPEEMSRKVKKVARFIGADLVGICSLNRNWVYSHSFDYTTGAHREIVFEDVDQPLVEDARQVIPNKVTHAIVLATEMDLASVATSPSPIEEASTGLGYSRMVMLASTLAEFIRALGYVAIPCGNDTALSIPLGIDAGLGQLGRNGQLITPEFGPRIRLCKVLTDLPLHPDNPIDFGVTEFCSVCKKCGRSCPSQAISYGEMNSEGPVQENNPGVMKWYINPRKCLEYYVSTGAPGCANCIMSCPFNKPRKWYHTAARWFINSVRTADKVWVTLDNLLGYGKRKPPENWWNLPA